MSDFRFEKSVDGYAARYDELLAKMLKKIDKEIYAIANGLNRLDKNATVPYLLANRQRIIDRLRNSTTGVFNTATSGAYSAAIDASERLFKGIKSVPFLETDLNIFTLVRQGALDELASYANIDGQDLFNQLLQYNLTGNRKILEEGLLANLDELRVARHGTTIVETNLMTFSRTVNGTRALNAGVDRYRYDGPGPDKIIRQFCKKHLGKEYTLDEINAMDNEQTGDVFFTCGGWNCRHRWTPIQK